MVILYAIPFFFLLIGIEYWVMSKYKKQEAYEFKDAITNLNIGVGNQVMSAIYKSFLLGGYVYLFNSDWRFLDMPVSWWSIALSIILVDFIYYVQHRMGHEVNLMWGAHIVHHQSEEFNYSVALRNSWFTEFVVFFLYLPIPLFGFPLEAFLVGVFVNKLYQFWIHTKTIDKFHPVVEYIFNTPSNHRVHHGKNPQYIDKNYGAIFMLWDHMFGTYEKEVEPVDYGITKTFQTHNPYAANIHYYMRLFNIAKRTKGIRNKLKILFAHPTWLPEDIEEFDERLAITVDRDTYRDPLNLSTKLYVGFQFAFILFSVSAYIYFFETMSPLFMLLLIGVIGTSMFSCTNIIEQKRLAIPFEYLRLLFAFFVINYFVYENYPLYFLNTMIITSIGLLLINAWFSTMLFRKRLVGLRS